MSNFDLNKVWPEWQIEGKPLGGGSYGIVYKAVRRDLGGESFSAIKVISIPQDESVVDSLRSEGMSIDEAETNLDKAVHDCVNEIKIMQSLKGYSNIVIIEDYKVVEKQDTCEWTIYIRMELLTSLNRYISDKILSEREVIKLGIDICTALERCSSKGIIHRDIKPGNILVKEDDEHIEYKLGDFGIARTLKPLTSGLSQKGTINFMAPEVAHGKQYDATVDLYSLGIVLYQLLNNN